MGGATPDEVFHGRRPANRRSPLRAEGQVPGEGRLYGAMGAGPAQDWSATRPLGHAVPRRAAPGAGRDPTGRLTGAAATQSPPKATSAWRGQGASSGALQASPEPLGNGRTHSRQVDLHWHRVAPPVFHWRLSMDRYPGPECSRFPVRMGFSRIALCEKQDLMLQSCGGQSTVARRTLTHPD
jgi:hypothetical protein